MSKQIKINLSDEDYIKLVELMRADDPTPSAWDSINTANLATLLLEQAIRVEYAKSKAI